MRSRDLENAVLDEFFEVLSSSKALRRAVFDGSPVGKVAEGLEKKKEAYQKQLQPPKNV